MKKILQLITIVSIISTALFCGSGDDPTIIKEITYVNTNSGTSDIQIAGLGQLTGNVGYANATVEFAHHPEYNTQTDAAGSFTLKNLMPGTYTLFITAAASDVVAAPPGAAKPLAVNPINGNLVAAQHRDVHIPRDTPVDLPAKAMGTPGSISGSVALLNNPNNVDLTGIDVYIPGTSYMAKSDAAGNFLIDNVPAGTYDVVRFDKPGLSSSELRDITVAKNADQNLGSVNMALSTGPSGEIIGITGALPVQIGGSPHEVLTSNTVSLELRYDTRAVLMKAAHESSFVNVAWELLAGAYVFDSATNPDAAAYFNSDGLKTAYVKFSDLNGLESSPVYRSFYVDTQPPVISDMALVSGWTTTATQDVYIDFTASDEGTGIAEVLLCEDSAFTGCATWQPYAPRMNFILSAGVGPKTVYAKVRDYLGRESLAASDSINLELETLVFGKTYEEPVTLYAAQSPYKISAGTVFNGGLTVEAGVTVLLRAPLTVYNGFHSVGTPANEIVFTSALDYCSSPASISMDNSDPGVSESYEVAYTRFQVSLVLNGGNFTNNIFDNSACIPGDYSLGPKNGIIKKGTDNLVIANNQFLQWKNALQVWDGNGNTVFDNNTGSVTSVLTQSGTGTNTVFSNNNLTCIGSGTMFDINGSVTRSGNTFSGDGTCSVFRVSSVDKVFSGFNVDGCLAIAYSFGDRGNLTITDSTFNCTNGVSNRFGTGSVTITNSDIAVSERLVYSYGDKYSVTNSNSSAIFDSNNITCANASGYCDLFYSEPYIGSTPGYLFEDTFTMTNNNIDCSGDAASGCRGFVAAKDVANDYIHVYHFDLSGNYWAGKALPASPSLTSGIITDSFANLGVVSDAANIAIYYFSPDCTPSLDGTGCPLGDFNNTWNIAPYTTVASPIAGVGKLP